MVSRTIKILVSICISLSFLTGFTTILKANRNSNMVNTDVTIKPDQKEIVALVKESILKNNNVQSNQIRISSISATGDGTWSVFYKVKLSKNSQWKPVRGDYCAEVARNISTNKLVLFFEKNRDNQLLVYRAIPFHYLYAGFILQKGNGVPFETTTINNQREWQKFKNKYFPRAGDMDYRFNTSIPVDFKKEIIICDSRPSPKEDMYSMAYQIDRIESVDNKLEVDMKYSKDAPMITVANYVYAVHRYIALLVINKSELTK